jgi:predicted nucleic acid-binding protein
VNGIADTGFLVAFAVQDDLHHGWAKEIGNRVTTPLLTCEAVLAETCFHLQSVSVVTGMLRDGLIAIAFSAADHLQQIEALARRYADRKPDFADLCLIRMSELHPRHSVVTTDREDFRIYRRNKREIIPLVCPS